MNLEIAARLIELRKKHGLSQEDLADKLGVSRQAVSKWERVEASPDTDNLIALAKLYGVSLDELLNYSPANPSPKADVNKDEDARDNEKFVDADDISDDKAEHSGNGDGIHIKDKDGKTKVHIGPKGIYVHDGDDIVDLSWDKGIHISSGEDGKDFHHNTGEPWHVFEDNKTKMGAIVDSVVFVLAIIAYVVASALTNMWHPLWIIFFFSPILAVPFDLKKFNGVFPLFVTGVFLALGFFVKAWHPGWVVFFAIPAYYIFADSVKKFYYMKHPKSINFSADDAENKEEISL